MDARRRTIVINPLAQHEWLVKAIVNSHLNRCNKYGFDADDLAQIARMALWKAQKLMPPDNEKFSAYASRAIRREIKHFIFECSTGVSDATRRRWGIKSYPEPNVIYLGNTFDPDDLMDEVETDFTNVIVVDFFNRIRADDAVLIAERMAGYSDAAIQRRHQISRSSFRHAIRRVQQAYFNYQGDDAQ